MTVLIKEGIVGNMNVIDTRHAISEKMINVQAQKAIRTMSRQKKKVTIRMGMRGDSSLNRMRTIKAVKKAVENHNAYDLVQLIDVEFEKNPYAGDFYRNVIANKSIRSGEIKTEE